jgi:hypothetical protein
MNAPKIVKATAHVEYDNGLTYDLDFAPDVDFHIELRAGSSRFHATVRIDGELTDKATRTPPSEAALAEWDSAE